MLTAVLLQAFASIGMSKFYILCMSKFVSIDMSKIYFWLSLHSVSIIKKSSFKNQFGDTTVVSVVVKRLTRHY